jgi:hypothetical protein
MNSPPNLFSCPRCIVSRSILSQIVYLANNDHNNSNLTKSKILGRKIIKLSRALYRKYSNKRVNAEKENIPFRLTYKEYKTLLNEAEITYKDIGNKGYHLARYNDEGAYEVENCRFIHYLENIKEKKVSEKSRKASRKQALKLLSKLTSEDRTRIGRLGGKVGGGHNKLTEQEIKNRIYQIEESHIDLQKYGWVSKVGKLLNISHTQVRRFMKEHYKKPYFIRQ